MLSDVLLGLLLLLIVWVFGWRIAVGNRAFDAQGPAAESVQGPTPVSPELAALKDVLAELAANRPRRMRPGVPVTIKLMSGSGRRELGSIVIEDRLREPTIRYFTSTDETLSVFAASACLEDGTWIYRRVGVEQLGRA